MNTLEKNTIPYRPDIDGLRAIAILFVVTFHAFPNLLPAGFIGVDIFFVISGFLICSIILKDLQENKFSSANFYARRVRRIFPAMLLVMMSSYIFGWFALLPDEFEQFGKHLAASAAFIANFFYWNETGYFDSAAELKPLLHLWSISVEEQFYLLCPWFLLIAYRKKINSLLWLLTYIAISFSINLYSVYFSNSLLSSYYLPQARFWELLMGGFLAYFLAQSHRPLKQITDSRYLFKANFFSICGIALLVLSLLLINKLKPFPGWWALLPTLGSAFLILAGSNGIINRYLLSNKVLVYIGLISYPLYLWHWPILSFLRISTGGEPQIRLKLIAILISFALAIFTYWAIEKPVRKLSNFIAIPALTFLMVIVLFVGLYTYLDHGIPNRDSIKNFNLSKEASRQFRGDLWEYSQNKLCNDAYRFNEAQTYGWWFCIQNKTQSPGIIILGTSQANQYYPGLIANSNLVQHSILSIGTCDVVPMENYTLDNKSPCYGRRSYAQKEFIDSLITTTPSLKYVILAGLTRDPGQEYIAKLKKRIDFFESHGLRVIIFTPDMRIEFNPKSCFGSPFNPNPKDCSFNDSQRKNVFEKFMPLISQLSISNPNVLFFEPNDMYCETSKCSFVKNSLPLHRDEGHISEYGSHEVQKYFSKWASYNLPALLKHDRQ